MCCDPAVADRHGRLMRRIGILALVDVGAAMACAVGFVVIGPAAVDSPSELVLARYRG